MGPRPPQEDSDPDRFVVVPLEGLSIRASDNGSDLETTMAAEDLAGLPGAQLDCGTATGTAQTTAAQ